MIEATIYKDNADVYKGFEILGHAGFAKKGKDIICAAVSILAINTINSIEEFTFDQIEIESDEKRGYIKAEFAADISHETMILMDSLVLGLKGIKEDYKGYIQLTFKEV